jgi:Holliday junction DNA helicase RuvB
MVGKGPGATSVSLEIAPFTLVGATTRSGVLASPLRDRFGFTANLEFYTTTELERVLDRAAAKLNVKLEPQALQAIATRSRGTPRVANRLLRRVRDYALVNGFNEVSRDLADSALELYEVDQLGLDRLDRQFLSLLCTNYSGRAVGLSTLAVSLGEEQETIESVVEPFLVRAGLVVRTPKGRQATGAAYKHLGFEQHPSPTN